MRGWLLSAAISHTVLEAPDRQTDMHTNNLLMGHELLVLESVVGE